MLKAPPSTDDNVFRDPETGRLFTVRGLDALKGRLTINPGIDLTKPIAEQVFGRPAKRRARRVSVQR